LHIGESFDLYLATTVLALAAWKAFMPPCFWLLYIRKLSYPLSIRFRFDPLFNWHLNVEIMGFDGKEFLTQCQNMEIIQLSLNAIICRDFFRCEPPFWDQQRMGNSV
jgi:hypothetical protein